MASVVKKDGCCGGDCKCGCGCNWGADFGKKLLLTFLGVVLVYSIFYLGTLVRNNIKKYDYIGKADRMEHSISVSGYGKVIGSNDIALTTIGYSNTDKDVAKAQAANNVVMDKVYADLKVLGVDDKDLTSDYSIYPDYNYTQDKGQQLVGYRVTNQVAIKIRDLSKITQVLNLAGKYGATQISGLSFTIDDPENLKAQAREKALADAQQKAVKLSNALGVKLMAVMNYNEYEGSNSYYPVKAVSAYGMGGGAVVDVAPEAVSAGSRDVVMNVNITYEISQ
ncbi:MAG: SIMPL domain-containing protein [Candidatus Magasanikbacteria bacterium]